MIFKFSFFAICRSFGNLAIEPSSSTISHKTAAGSKPANTARSTEASVCPGLLRTPPSLYFRGNIWPGRLKSSGLEFLDASFRIVVALSWADTPVVVPCFASYNMQIVMVSDKKSNQHYAWKHISSCSLQRKMCLKIIIILSLTRGLSINNEKPMYHCHCECSAKFFSIVLLCHHQWELQPL